MHHRSRSECPTRVTSRSFRYNIRRHSKAPTMNPNQTDRSHCRDLSDPTSNRDRNRRGARPRCTDFTVVVSPIRSPTSIRGPLKVLQTPDRALCPARRSKVVLKAGISAFLHPGVRMYQNSDTRIQSMPMISLLPGYARCTHHSDEEHICTLRIARATCVSSRVLITRWGGK